MRKQLKTNEKGFTLIEVVVTLILVGILAVIGSIGLVNMVQGYVTAKANAAAVQKGQIGMLQITKILNLANRKSITGATPAAITFVLPSSAATHTLLFDSNSGIVTLDGDTVIDRVNQFKLGYYDSHNASEQSTWSSSSKMIEVTMLLDLGQGELSPEFKTRIVPRNDY
ncbi:MAG: type II secretion system GspH family protein [Deltaproteobacteria bacterium]